jgi:hypothetical protein
MQTEKININFLGTEFLEICARELLRSIDKESAPIETKKEIIEEFITNFAEDTAVLIVNHTDTDEHLEEIVECSNQDSSFTERRKLFTKYIPDFDNKIRELINLYVQGFQKKYS